METSVLRRSRVGLPRSRRLLAALGDDRLVEQIRRGNDVAFEVVYDRHHRGILAFCRHMLGSREEAEDAVQQTFASAYADLASNDRDIRLKAWLYTIARNRCLSILRARREHPAEIDDQATAGLSEDVERRADLRELLDDLRELPPGQREALVLFELGDLSHAEVARVIGVDPVKVKALVFQARSTLIENREARAIPCAEIREQLATATGGALRRGPLRRHLKACPGCSEYRDQVRAQRSALALVLPVVPTVGLKEAVLAAIGGSGGAGGAGVAAGGAALGGGTAAGSGGLVASLAGAGGAKLAVAAALAGGTLAGGGLAIERATHDGGGSKAEAAEASGGGGDAAAPAAPGGGSGPGPSTAVPIANGRDSGDGATAGPDRRGDRDRGHGEDREGDTDDGRGDDRKGGRGHDDDGNRSGGEQADDREDKGGRRNGRGPRDDERGGGEGKGPKGPRNGGRADEPEDPEPPVVVQGEGKEGKGGKGPRADVRQNNGSARGDDDPPDDEKDRVPATVPLPAP